MSSSDSSKAVNVDHSVIVESLKQALPFITLKTDEASLKHWGKDWTTYFDINASAIAFPKTTNDLVDLVHWARKSGSRLVPSGGRTGLSGAAVATQGEVVVSFDLMNQILEFNEVDHTVRIQPGVITEELQNFALSKNLYYPVDFAARGSSQMGGNIATNAGGIKVVRYGLTRQWVAGLEVVTGAGEVLKLNNALEKNATGYDLRHLFIGSEGTLGFITEATIKLAPSPPPMNVFIMACNELSDIMNVFSVFKNKTSLVAFEMFSDLALNKVLEGTGLPAPLGSRSNYYVLAEVENSSDSQSEKNLSAFESCIESGWVTDGVLSQSEAQSKQFWRYREDISENLSKYSPYKNDIAVAVSQVPAFMTDLDQILKTAYPTWEVVWFGHVGDGNLHINILRPPEMTKEVFVSECRKVDKLIFESIQKFRGSISAEHGVGLTKRSFLNFTRSNSEIELMKGIKKVFDPDNVMNPGKIFE